MSATNRCRATVLVAMVGTRLVSAGPAPAADTTSFHQHPSPSCATAHLAGFVRARDGGASIAGATVRLSTAVTCMGSATTDERGKYDFGRICPGEYRLDVEAKGFRGPGDERTVRLDDGRASEVSFALAGGATLTGRVTTCAGVPIAGAKLERDTTNTRDDFDAATSDDEGRFRLVGLPSDPRINVSAPGFGTRQIEVGFLAPATEHALDVVLGVGHRLRGRVVDASDAPLAGTDFYVFGRPRLSCRGERNWFVRHIRSGPDGTFEVDGLGPGKYALQLTGEGTALEAVSVEVADQDVEGVVVRRLASKVTGIVTDESGRPVARATIVAKTDRTTFGPPDTDTSGRFEIPAPLGTTMTLTVSAEGFQALDAGTASPGDPEHVVVLHRAACLVGTVVDGDGGTPVRRFFAGGHEVVSDAGRFRYCGLERGAKLVRLWAPGYSWLDIGPYGAAPGDEVDAGVQRLVRGATVRGRVLDPSGRPVAGVRVAAMRVEDRDSGIVTPDREDPEGYSGADGSYEIHHLSEGAWRVAAQPGANGFRADRTDPSVEIRGQAPVDSVDVTIRSIFSR